MKELFSGAYLASSINIRGKVGYFYDEILKINFDPLQEPCDAVHDRTTQIRLY